MKKRLPTIIMAVVFLIGFSVLLYPSVSEVINAKRQTRAVADYTKSIASIPEKDSKEILKKADEYNKRLATRMYVYESRAAELADYESQLNVDRGGVMAVVEIEKIDVRLPVYHGTHASVLQVGVGHLEGYSLPIGGGSTHAVLSAHRGLPSAKLFTDLDQMIMGDTFQIYVLDQVLTYEVDSIRIIEPTEMTSIQIESGKDYVTLVTCTPYAINTHRLLVRGKRIPTPVKEQVLQTSAEPFDTARAVSMAAIFLIIFILNIAVVKREVDVSNEKLVKNNRSGCNDTDVCDFIPYSMCSRDRCFKKCFTDNRNNRSGKWIEYTL